MKLYARVSGLGSYGLYHPGSIEEHNEKRDAAAKETEIVIPEVKSDRPAEKKKSPLDLFK
jgi:hypothetical protein